jgi:type IV pilus assembly protein PilZ
VKLADKLTELGRRLWRRVPVGIPAEVEWADRRLAARCRNLSLGGAFIETEIELPLGSTVTLRLARPDVIEDVALQAEVRWHEVGGAGLRFVQPSARDLWVLSPLVK